MATKRSLLLAALLAIIAVLYQVEVVTTRWEAEDYALIRVEQNKLWKLLTNHDNVDKWFHWISIIRAVDSRPVERGKRYEAVYTIPFIGEYIMPLQVTQYVPNRQIVIESESLLKPKFTILLQNASESHTKVQLKLSYKRNSALYRCTLGPLVWLLSSQQLRQSLFLIKMLFPS